MAFKVRYSAEAEADLDSILHWLVHEQRAGETGLRWFQGLTEKIGTLASRPERCGFAPENKSLPFQLRQLIYGHKKGAYRVLFTVIDDVVYIIAIRRPRQDAFRLH